MTEEKQKRLELLKQRKQLLEEVILKIHIKNIQERKYDVDTMISLLDNGEIEDFQIQDFIPKDEYNKIVPRTIEVEFYLWRDYYPLPENKTDLYFFGIPGQENL